MSPKKRIIRKASRSNKKKPESDPEPKPLLFNLDPIGRHIMALRIFYSDLLNRDKNTTEPPPSIPEYPVEYPSPDYLSKLRSKDDKDKEKEKQQFYVNGDLSHEKVNELMTISIERILLQIGFEIDSLEDDEVKLKSESPLALLSDVADMFLQSFVGRLRYHKDSCKSLDLWDLVETTLQEWGFHGVHGIGRYFFEDFVQLHDSLYNECEVKLQEISSVKEEEDIKMEETVD